MNDNSSGMATLANYTDSPSSLCKRQTPSLLNSYNSYTILLSEKVSFAGRVIPPGTGLMSNIYAAHTDPEVILDYENIKPFDTNSFFLKTRPILIDNRCGTNHWSFDQRGIWQVMLTVTLLWFKQLHLLISRVTQQYVGIPSFRANDKFSCCNYFHNFANLSTFKRV